MDFPSTNDFLAEFGIEPEETDPSLAFYRYAQSSTDGMVNLEISFSMIMKSFEAVLTGLSGRRLAIISSEGVKCINLWRDDTGAGLHVTFDIRGTTSEVCVTLEPDLSFCWWTLLNE